MVFNLFVQSPPTGTLLQNHPLLMILMLAKILFQFENISMLMKQRDSLVSTENKQTKRMQLHL